VNDYKACILPYVSLLACDIEIVKLTLLEVCLILKSFQYKKFVLSIDLFQVILIFCRHRSSFSQMNINRQIVYCCRYTVV
jgi:hypothetical protein